MVEAVCAQVDSREADEEDEDCEEQSILVQGQEWLRVVQVVELLPLRLINLYWNKLLGLLLLEFLGQVLGVPVDELERV